MKIQMRGFLIAPLIAPAGFIVAFGAVAGAN